MQVAAFGVRQEPARRQTFVGKRLLSSANPAEASPGALLGTRTPSHSSSISMSVRQIGKGAAQIPSNAELLEFPRTDGRKKEWPSNTEKVVDSAGAVNYMSAQTIDNAPSPIWRKNAGQKVAAALKLPGGEHNVSANVCNADASVAEEGNAETNEDTYGMSLGENDEKRQ